MSQIDQLIYLPLLYWFIIFLLVYYIIIFKTIIPFIYTIHAIRSNYFIYRLTTNNTISNIISSIITISRKK